MAETWPYTPLVPVAERLEWRTDILDTREGEQRLALRTRPRESLLLRHRLDEAELAEAVARLRAGFAEDWLVPAWPLGSAADSVPEVSAYIAEPPQIARQRRGRSILTVRFALRATAEAAASPFPAYLGADVVTDPTILRGPASESARRLVAYVDGGLGRVAVEPQVGFFERRYELRLGEHGAPPRTARRQWLRGIRGRLRSFWLATWGNEFDLRAPVGAGATQIRVAPVGAAAPWVGRHLVLDAPSGPAFAEITAAAEDGADRLLTVSPGLPEAPQTALAHELVRVRLDADAIEILHTNARSEFSAPAIEVPA